MTEGQALVARVFIVGLAILATVLRDPYLMAGTGILALLQIADRR